MTQIYPTADRPRFIKGHGITMAMVGFSCLCYCVLWFYFSSVNASRERGAQDHRVEGMTDDDIAEMGDDSPRFRYTI